jgi:hypothetical protein
MQDIDTKMTSFCGIQINQLQHPPKLVGHGSLIGFSGICTNLQWQMDRPRTRAKTGQLPRCEGQPAAADHNIASWCEKRKEQPAVKSRRYILGESEDQELVKGIRFMTSLVDPNP